MSVKALPEKRKLEFFYPSFFKRCVTEAEKLGRLEQKDYTRLGWTLILTDELSVDFTKVDQLLDAFALLEEVLLGERELLWFLERPRPGKKGHQARFWLFFDLQVAREFFIKRADTPLDFRPDENSVLPQMDIRQVFLENLSQFPEDSPAISSILVQINRLIDLCQFYLGDEETEIPQNLKHKAALLGVKEANRLKLELGNSGDLSTRFKVLHGVTLRHFVQKNEVEEEYLEKLLSNDADQQLKGLNFCEMRIQKEIR